MSEATHDLRCPTCSGLLGRVSGGQVEVKRSHELVATVRDGRLYCARCSTWVEVESEPAEKVLRVLGLGGESGEAEK